MPFPLRLNRDAPSEGSLHPSGPRGGYWSRSPATKLAVWEMGLPGNALLLERDSPWVTLGWARS